MSPSEHTNWLENSQLVLQTLRRLDADIKTQDAKTDRRHDENAKESRAMRDEIAALRAEILELKQKVRGQAGMIAFMVALVTSLIGAALTALLGKH